MEDSVPAEAFAPSFYLRSLEWREISFERGMQISDGRAGKPGLELWPTPTEAGYFWPHPIWRVEQIEGFETYAAGRLWRCRAFTVVDELPARLAFGPRAEEVVTLLGQVARLGLASIRRTPDLLGELSPGTTGGIADQRIWATLRNRCGTGPAGREMKTALGNAVLAVHQGMLERLEALKPEAYWTDEHITDRAWASTYEAAGRFAASIILAGRLPPDALEDLAAPWRQIESEAIAAQSR